MTTEELLEQMPTLDQIVALAGIVYEEVLAAEGEIAASQAADKLIAAHYAQIRLYKKGLRRPPTTEEIETIYRRM